MKFELFSQLYKEAEKYDDVETYIAERGWQEWMEDYGGEGNPSAVARILETIFDLQKQDIRSMRESNGYSGHGSRKRFCDIYGFTVRRVEDWENEKSNGRISDSDKMLIAYTFFINGVTP